MESKIVKNDLKNLDAFVKGLTSGYVVRVGIMGEKNNRNDPKAKGQSNADIGVTHELGVPGRIPQRSFLRMPLRLKSATILKEMAQVQMVKKLGKGDFLAILADLGHICERVILDAFDTGGFGLWKKNAPSTIRRKGGAQPLIDLGFLRKSISSEVVKL